MKDSWAKAISEGLGFVANLLHVGSPEAIAAAKTAIELLLKADSGEMRPEDVLAQIQTLQSKLAQNNAAADAALAEKFKEKKDA